MLGRSQWTEAGQQRGGAAWKQRHLPLPWVHDEDRPSGNRKAEEAKRLCRGPMTLLGMSGPATHARLPPNFLAWQLVEGCVHTDARSNQEDDSRA